MGNAEKELESGPHSIRGNRPEPSPLQASEAGRREDYEEETSEVNPAAEVSVQFRNYMRLLIVSMLLFCLSGSPTARNKQQSQPKKQDTVNQGTPAPATPVTATVNQSPAPPQKESSETKAHDWYEWFWPPIWSNWGLVIVGAYGVYVALGSLSEIKRQSVTTEKAASAAFLNAQAVVNAERAWLAPELRCLSRQSKDGRWYHPDGTLLSAAEVLAGKHLLYGLKLTNQGKTPAQIIGFQIAYSCLPGIAFDCPAEGQFMQTHEFPHFLAGGEAVEITEPPIDVTWYMHGFRDAISRNEKTAIFHGWVKYRHVFSTIDCHVDFCYAYIVKENRLSSFGRHSQQR